ncbi:MAG: hypothetical protein ACRDUV_00620 [Pseudonocardiaceae bacterium]
MDADDLLAPFMKLRAELRPEELAFKCIVEPFKKLVLQLEGTRWDLPSSNRHLLDAVLLSLKKQLDELDGPDPAEVSEQSAQAPASGGHVGSDSIPSEQSTVGTLPETAIAGEDDTDPGDRNHDRIRDALCTIWRNLNADSTARRYLRELGDPPGRADALWKELHLASWRLPENENQVWRDQFRNAVVAVLGGEALPALPSELGATVVPTVDWQGMFARDTDPIADTDEAQWVRDRLGDAAGRFAELISAVANVLTLLSAGDSRRMTWRTRHRPGDRKLEIDQNLIDYRNELKVELEDLGKQQPDSAAELRALVNIDERVRSVTYDPLPAPDSGWARNVEKLLAWLRSQADRSGAEVEELAGTYQGCLDRTKDNVKASELQNGASGQVLWTLRTWSSIAGEISPGRVIYVPTR